MARNDYTCAVCGKTLTIAGPRNIELHEKSKFHMAAVDKEKVTEQSPESEPINEIRTTTAEVKNGKKETRKRDSGDSGDSGVSGDSEDSGVSGDWDGYLC